MTRPWPRGGRRPGARTWIIIFGPVVALLGCFLVAIAFLGVDPEAVLRDPMSTLGGAPLTGAGSVIGVLIWWTAVGVCLFAAAVLRQARAEHQIISFLVTAAILSAILSLDDQFLFHEELAEDLVGLRERFVVIIYVGLVAAWLLWYRRIIAESAWPILMVSVGLFAASVAIDGLHQALYVTSHGGETLPVETFLEDSLKLLGIAGWTAYLIDVSYRAVIEARIVRSSEGDQGEAT
jgi:hypothetical protein